MNGGIMGIAEAAGRFYMGSHAGRTFMLRCARRLRKAAGIRQRHERGGVHVPPFLIASVAARCNLRCAGCYARAGTCGGADTGAEMDAAAWRDVFAQASEAGVAFILLAGGEPLLRRDVIEAAAQCGDVVFPVFTNGTLIDGAYLALFDKHRHVIPVMSIEGGAESTDARRGAGVSAAVADAAAALAQRGILYGVSITVTAQNYEAVTAPSFVDALRGQGCGLVFFVEYVPAEAGTEHLTLSDSDALTLSERIDGLRGDSGNRGMVLLSFPGDEDAMGGCLAAGRGFFHINAAGGAEPCPFSPYSDMNVRQHSLLDVLRSPFFEQVRAISAAEALGRKGGCTLFQHEDAVKNTLGGMTM